jgi:hypothetical protein
MASVRAGLFPPVAHWDGGPERLRATLARVAEKDLDHVCVDDHASFESEATDAGSTLPAPSRPMNRVVRERAFRSVPDAVARQIALASERKSLTPQQAA